MQICPSPQAWIKIYSLLERYADTHPCIPPRPPILLVLNGWAYSDDIDKLYRWEETVKWADNNGCGELISNIEGHDFYSVPVLEIHEVEPHLLPWTNETKPCPSPKQLEECTKILTSRWEKIVGDEMGKVTRPMAFKGRKHRRLLVLADNRVRPPWGTWSKLSYDRVYRRTFTRFRAAVNKAIAPHAVDHIDFITQVHTAGEPPATGL